MKTDLTFVNNLVDNFDETSNGWTYQEAHV